MGRAFVIGVGAAVVAFAAGLSLGLVMGSDGDAGGPPDAAFETGAAETNVSVETSETTAAERAGEASPRRRTRDGGSGPSVIPESLGAIDPSEIVSGDGVISGHVRRRDGTPVAGVVVWSTANRPKHWKRPADAAPFEERMEYSARTLRWQDATRREATTDVEGAYSLAGLADSAHLLRATADGYGMHVAGGGNRVRPGVTVDFVAMPRTQITFRIVDPDGKEPESAEIVFKNSNRSETWGWTPSSPTRSLGPVTTTLIVQSGEYREMRSKPRPFEITAGDPERVVEVTLRQSPGVGGRVRSEGPAASNGLRVRLLRVKDGQVPTAQQLRRSSNEARAKQHEDFRFSFAELSPGTYAIGVGRDYNSVDVIELVEVGDRFVLRDLVVPDYDRDACLELVVLDPDGARVSEFDVMLQWKSEHSSSSSGATAVRRPGGEVWVPLDADHDAKTGTHSVRVTSAKWGSAVQRFTPGSGARAEVHFVEPSRATVVIGGYTGSVVEGRVKIGLRHVDEQWARAEMEVDASGRATLPPLAPGEYEVQLQETSSRHRSRVLAEQRVNLTSGVADVPISVPALHTLTVTLPGEVGRRQVGLRANGERGVSPLPPDENGRIVFDLLPPGEYTITVYNGKGGSKKVTIPDTTHVDL